MKEKTMTQQRCMKTRLLETVQTTAIVGTVALVFIYELLITQKLFLHGLLIKNIHARGSRLTSVKLRYRDVLRLKLLYTIRYLRRDNTAYSKWATSLHHNIKKDLQQRNLPQDVVLSVPVVEINEITPEQFFLEYIKKGDTPVVIKGVTSTAKSKWTKEFLSEKCGHLPLTYKNKKTDVITDHTLAEFLNQGQPNDTVPTGPVLNNNKEMLEDLGIHRFSQYMHGFFSRFSIGPMFALMHIRQIANNGIMHCEESNNLYFMLQGRKKVTLVHPEHTWLVYPVVTAEASSWFTLLNEEPGREDLSLYRYCPRFEVILEPGDVMMFPSWMWHQFDNLSGNTLAVATNWLPLSGVTNRFFRMTQLFSGLFWRQLYSALAKQTNTIYAYKKA